MSTVHEGKPHSRMMSIVCIDNKFYFQTDKNFSKCQEIADNPHVSVCIDNIQIEGICKIIGKPFESKKFCDIFSTEYPNAYKLYSSLDNEVLYEIEPYCIKCWIYENEVPYIETYNIPIKQYRKIKYDM